MYGWGETKGTRVLYSALATAVAGLRRISFIIHFSRSIRLSFLIPPVKAKHICWTLEVLLAPGNKEKKEGGGGGVGGSVQKLMFYVFYLKSPF